jgi:hypothetical protein
MMKDTQTPPELKPGPQPGAQSATAAEGEIRRLRERAEAAEAALAAKDEQMAALAQALPLQPLDEPPEYELTEYYFSQDCVLYPPGSVFRDLYGTVIPSPSMIALNAAAEERYDRYMASLPGGETQPTHEQIVEAAMEIRPREGDDPRLVAEFHGKVLERALLKRFAAQGHLPREPGQPQQRVRPQRPQRPDPNIPIMSNVRIRQLQTGAEMFSPASRLMSDTNLPRRQTLTERIVR